MGRVKLKPPRRSKRDGLAVITTRLDSINLDAICHCAHIETLIPPTDADKETIRTVAELCIATMRWLTVALADKNEDKDATAATDKAFRELLHPHLAALSCAAVYFSLPEGTVTWRAVDATLPYMLLLDVGDPGDVGGVRLHALRGVRDDLHINVSTAPAMYGALA